ncbi:hypothetical protein EYF80_048224 [Liparis tanakae]|uniref:Uncharacterized protein n=1 Tax=Liparis tanakae TaxID=230148 RepID=A0A4Z2FKC3_9TELE|nr:hypothetical protein EYF80_048224 [Liparis tanakae]
MSPLTASRGAGWAPTHFLVSGLIPHRTALWMLSFLPGPESVADGGVRVHGLVTACVTQHDAAAKQTKDAKVSVAREVDLSSTPLAPKLARPPRTASAPSRPPDPGTFHYFDKSLFHFNLKSIQEKTTKTSEEDNRSSSFAGWKTGESLKKLDRLLAPLGKETHAQNPEEPRRTPKNPEEPRRTPKNPEEPRYFGRLLKEEDVGINWNRVA